MADDNEEDDSYYWVRSPGDLEVLDVPDVPVPDLQIVRALYELEYKDWLEQAYTVPLPQYLADLDPNYRPIPVKQLNLDLLVTLRTDVAPTWAELWSEITNGTFIWPNYKACLNGPIRCFQCVRPLSIPYLQEKEGAFKFETDAEFEEAVVMTGACTHVVGAQCLHAWLKSKYPSELQREYYRWLRGEVNPADWSDDLASRVAPYFDNEALRRTIDAACPVCDAPQAVESNFGTITMDAKAAWYRYPNIKRVDKQHIQSHAEQRWNDGPTPGFPPLVLRSKESYYKEVQKQQDYWKILESQLKLVGCTTHPVIPGGPYNTLDYAYLKNKAYENHFRAFVGERLFQDHVWRLQNPEYSGEESEIDAMEIDDDHGGNGGGLPRTPPPRPPQPPQPPQPPPLRHPRQRRPRPQHPARSPPPPRPVPNPWPVDYDTPSDEDPCRCPWCGKGGFKEPKNRRKHEIVAHARPNLGNVGAAARLARRRQRKDTADALERARKVGLIVAANPNDLEAQRAAWVEAMREQQARQKQPEGQPLEEPLRQEDPVVDPNSQQARDEYAAKLRQAAGVRVLEAHEQVWLQQYQQAQQQQQEEQPQPPGEPIVVPDSDEDIYGASPPR
ncbi:hypothetical protein QBC41DRAFT_390391 [Cercophora samala]|uniref:Uncharacterized protein n=1 Tax=Cercophora samala TaxID=330535 RepID=A0AA39ZFN1_9PEZI|nr:hypothetical protein QBC41DRAFT_390391 [Cercophora samala]